MEVALHIDDDDIVNAIVLAEVLSDDPPPPPGAPPSFPPPPPRGPSGFMPDPARRPQGDASGTGCGAVTFGCLGFVLMLVGAFTVLKWLFVALTRLF